jgi:hypothetical protein
MPRTLAAPFLFRCAQRHDAIIYATRCLRDITPLRRRFDAAATMMLPLPDISPLPPPLILRH